jgi:hypothetical protein
MKLGNWIMIIRCTKKGQKILFMLPHQWPSLIFVFVKYEAEHNRGCKWQGERFRTGELLV